MSAIAPSDVERSKDAAPYCRADFDIPGIYLDCAARHPLPRAGVEALGNYADYLGRIDGPQGLASLQDEIRRQFAAMINAAPDEIVLAPTTTSAEHWVLHALGLPDADDAIVTDRLHFRGSVARYEGLANAGANIVIVEAQDGEIDLNRMVEAIVPGVRLVAISSVSHRNGFCHDLKAICDAAHAVGALVYADIIQHAGCLPLDVRESGVDFCACASYKWLLGDMGLGFLYVRQEVWPMLRSPLTGNMRGTRPGIEDAASLLAAGSFGAGAAEILARTLPRIAAFVQQRPQHDWSVLTRHAVERFGEIGLHCVSPNDSPSPIRTFAYKGSEAELSAALGRSGVRITTHGGMLRVSPGCFTILDDIDEAAAVIRSLQGPR